MRLALLATSLLLFVACSSPQSNPVDTARAVTDRALAQPQEAPMAKAELAAPAGEPPQPEPSTPQRNDRKIIRNATFEFKVADFRGSAARIKALVGTFSGLISTEQEVRENDVLKSQMTIRIPAARLDPFLDTLLHESVYTTVKRITAEDVTKQFVDTEARIRNQKATETRYRELLKQARSVKDILEVDEQLRAIREEVDIQEAELRELKTNVALSTVELTFYQNTEATSAPESPYLSRFWLNLKSGFGLIGGFFLGLAYLLPLVIILGSIGWAITWWVRRRSKHV